jgi:glucose/arabinose dehydrogenase
MTRSACLFGAMIVSMLAPTSELHGGDPALTTEVFAQGLFKPDFVTFAPDDPERVFIVQQNGVIRVAVNGVLEAQPFLDASSLQPSETFNGMLGLAFHPDYQNNGHFYVHHTIGGASSNALTIARYTVTADPNVANAGSRQIVLQLGFPFFPGHHLGGWIGFGPDGHLYIPLGDGGTTGDANGGARSQDLSLPWGKLLRVDVNGDDFPANPKRNYAIPPDSPFVGMGGDEAVWSYGLRQPFRACFDRETNDLWIADVGLVQREEISIQPAASTGGDNYGWDCAEGFLCSTNGNCSCLPGALVRPTKDYDHSGGNCSISGGAVYRGCAIDGLDGTDRTVELNANGEPTITSITGVSEDYYGELYICSQNGRVYKIIPAGGIVDDDGNGIADACEAQACLGDTDGNGEVDIDDIVNVVLDFGTDGSANGGDADGSGLVDIDDIVLVVLQFGTCPGQ